jgi:hypothetical protein
MSPENRRAVEYIATSVIASNQSDRGNIVARLPGATEAEVDAMIDYLQGCPKIVHFPIETVLSFFVADTHYRNQFETGSSRGMLSAQMRQQWETTLFGNAYAQCQSAGAGMRKVVSAPGGGAGSYTVRPKYGVVNYDYDPLGCKLARQTYGEAFLVLKNVEDRVTYSWGDSGALSSKAGAAAGAARTSLAFGVWMCRLLAAMSDEDLKTVRGLANGKIKPGHAKLSQYLEFQVHGPIRFSQDVAAVVVPERFRDAVTLPQGWLSFIWNQQLLYRRKSASAKLPLGLGSSGGRRIGVSVDGRTSEVMVPAHVAAGGSFSYTTAVSTTAPSEPGTYLGTHDSWTLLR